MTSAFGKKIRKLTPEQEILLNRQLMGGISGVVCYLVGLDIDVSMAFLVYILCNGALFAMQRAKIWKDEQRWFAAIVLDVAMAMATMFIQPEAMSWAYPIILWMILGNGFRFGLKWLAIASVMSVIGFGTIFATTDYWASNQILGVSLVLALVAIPAYCSTLIRKLSKSKEDAEAANRAKSYFLASVSHELRTPLNAIIGYGNHLRNEKLPAHQHDMVDASVLAGEHLLHLIDQLMQISKSEVGPTVNAAKSNFVPTELLTEIREIMKVRAEDKQLLLQVQAAPLSDAKMYGPAETIRNLLINLISNAIKFTESGSVSISLSCSGEGDEKRLNILVSDTGIGIAAEALDRIFQPFQQADETVSNRFGGTGLGLAICRQLVEQVGGNISVESVVGKGSSFHVQVPVEQAQDGDQNEQVISTEATKIISLGDFSAEMLASAQSADNFSIYHVKCHHPHDLENAVSNCELDQFHVALIDQRLANAISPESALWKQFSDAKVAPVLVQHDNEIDIEDVSLRAAFASIIPAAPDFDSLRSAIRIGCSFANKHGEREQKQREAEKFDERYVLVADDNRTNRNILATILEAAGHRVKTVNDGDDALDALENEKFDILLLDVNMPRLNGIDACKMWRQIEGSRSRLPIIGVTADATEETQKKCIDAGMDVRVTKPVNAKSLLKLIDEKCGGTAEASAQLALADDPLERVQSLKPVEVERESSIDPAQISYLRSIGSEDFLSEMIVGFLEDIAETQPQFAKAAELKDVAQFRFCAHAFKSSANNIGAKRLALICGDLEAITETDFGANRLEYLAKVEAELDQVRIELNAIETPKVSKTG